MARPESRETASRLSRLFLFWRGTPPQNRSDSRAASEYSAHVIETMTSANRPFTCSAHRRACLERASGFVLRAHVDNSDADWRLAFSCGGEIDRRTQTFPVRDFGRPRRVQTHFACEQVTSNASKRPKPDRGDCSRFPLIERERNSASSSPPIKDALTATAAATSHPDKLLLVRL